jgi:pimeloyl-ACP methyl ester carboxylesterase
MMTETSLISAAVSVVGHPTQATSLESTSATTTYHRMTIDGVGVFYREAGPKDASTIVLLHGFPSSSREFDTLIPLLATRYHLVAPDFPGFGQSDAPPPSSYVYTFDNLAKTINGVLEQLNINKYTFYLHDYGGSVGFRIISAHPERLRALTPSAPRTPNAITRTRGLTSTSTCRDPANARSRPICCTTAGRMSHPIRHGKRGCASTGR